MLQLIKTWIYFLLISVLAVAFALTGPFLLLVPVGWRYWWFTRWSCLCITLAKVICGLNYKVTGQEHLPKDQAVIIMAKHQSMWEALFFQLALPRQTWILKRELLFIPFFGWGLATIQPIAVDRKNKNILRSIVNKAKQFLDKGVWVIIFPEGTRLKPGEQTTLTHTGALLATKTKYPIIPVTHNAGEFWPKSAKKIHPGTIEIKFGAMITPQEHNTKEINQLITEYFYS